MTMKIKRLQTQEVVTIPSDMEDGVIYVSRRFGLAIHRCACGCGAQTVTPFEGCNAWSLADGDQGVTLRPSIGNQNFPCGSHYWITNGEVVPC